MSIYQHYSFDLWLTLIKSNPLFKTQRSRIFFERYNKRGKSLPEVEQAFRQVDIMCNNVNEATGKNIDSEEMYLMVISVINDNAIDLHAIDLHALYLEMEALLFENMPLIYCDSTPGVLAYIKEQSGITTNLLSNTGFIKGVTLRKVLKHLDIDQFFDFQLYSDEAGLSKPGKAFFQLMIDRIFALKAISLDQIIHIGDNPIADIAGANVAGISSMLINSNNRSIVKLITDATPHLFTA